MNKNKQIGLRLTDAQFDGLKQKRLEYIQTTGTVISLNAFIIYLIER